MSKIDICSTCCHSQVCRYHDTCRRAQNIARHSILYEIEAPGEVQPIQLVNLEFVSDVNVNCKYYQPVKTRIDI